MYISMSQQNLLNRTFTWKKGKFLMVNISSILAKKIFCRCQSEEWRMFKKMVILYSGSYNFILSAIMTILSIIFCVDGITRNNSLFLKEGQIPNENIDSLNNIHYSKIKRKRNGRKFPNKRYKGSTEVQNSLRLFSLEIIL